MIVLNEGLILESNKEILLGKKYKVIFKNKEYSCNIIRSQYKMDDIDKQLLTAEIINNCMKYINSLSLYNYIFNYQKDFLQDCGLYSGKDLFKLLNQLTKITSHGHCLYIIGSCNFDEEHGFSIAFPMGKFIKSKESKFDYERDCGALTNYQPKITFLSDANQ